MRARVYCVVMTGILAAGPAGLAAGAVPEGYVKKATWVDTMIAAREAHAARAGKLPTRRALPEFGTGQWTVTAWIRTRGGGTIFARTAESGRWVQGGKCLYIRGNRLTFDVGWVGACSGGPRVNDGQWHHVAVVGRPGRQEIYVDGKLGGRGRLEQRADKKEWVLKIGRCSTNFGGDFKGEIDELRVYARALSAADVAARFKKPAAASEPHVVGYWPFEGDGYDASESLNDAKVPDGCTFVAGKAGKALRLPGRAGAVVPAGGAADPLGPVWAQLRKDFADEASRREMAWEQEDGIWGGAVTAGDLSLLAASYARASHRLASVAKKLAAAAPSVTDRAALAKVRKGYHQTRRHAEAVKVLSKWDLAGLREMIRSLMRTEGEGYAAGARHLERLDELEKQGIRAMQGDGGADLADWVDQITRLRRAALIEDNPLIDFDKLVFVRRKTFQSNHYYTDFINGCRYYGGNLCLLDLKTGKVTELCPSLKEGIFGRFDLSFDAKRVVFGWKRSADEGFRIYEVGTDGKGLRQLTFPPDNEAELIKSYRVRYHHGTDDMHPCYLPDGGFCFISTRCQYGILCDGPDDFTTTVLYRIDADGGSMEKLTNSSVSEASPIAMADGRILYTRWEYVDKGAVSVKCLWAVRPDGTGSVEVYGNDISLPPTMTQARDIPGYTDLYVMMGTPHYPQGRLGTVIRLDMTRDIRTRDPMTYITPQVDIRSEGGFHHPRAGGGWERTRNGPLFAEPFPLSDKWFLVSHNPDKSYNDATAYGLYLLGEGGKTVLIHDEAETSCWQPVPLRARPRPPVLTASRDEKLAADSLAVAVVTDIYHDMANVERGEVKYLRVLEQVPRPWKSRRRWGGDVYDQQHACISKDTHLGLKVQYGIVPVEADGSAHLVVPADRNIFFQALDENYMAVQTERTYVNYRPGEARACIGCHETPNHAGRPMVSANVAALRRPPSVPGPQPGEKSGNRPLHYPSDVQPVLDKHCVKCHGGAEPKGGLNLTGEMTQLFSVSYESLLRERRRGRGRRGQPVLGLTIGENHPKTGNVHYLPPKSMGSHASILVAMLSKGRVKLLDPAKAQTAAKLAKVHEKIDLPLGDRIRLTNWVDTNAQYYGSYYGRRNIRYKDHPNFRPVPTWSSAIGICPLPEEKR